jgi:hypothetical protein
VLLKVYPTALEAAQHIAAWHVMAALLDSGGDAPERQLGQRDTQIRNFDPPTGGFPAL